MFFFVLFSFSFPTVTSAFRSRKKHATGTRAFCAHTQECARRPGPRGTAQVTSPISTVMRRSPLTVLPCSACAAERGSHADHVAAARSASCGGSRSAACPLATAKITPSLLVRQQSLHAAFLVDAVNTRRYFSPNSPDLDSRRSSTVLMTGLGFFLFVVSGAARPCEPIRSNITATSCTFYIYICTGIKKKKKKSSVGGHYISSGDSLPGALWE